jgi:hypothetical protein
VPGFLDVIPFLSLDVAIFVVLQPNLKSFNINVLSTHANFLHFKKFNMNVLTTHATHFNYLGTC